MRETEAETQSETDASHAVAASPGVDIDAPRTAAKPRRARALLQAASDGADIFPPPVEAGAETEIEAEGDVAASVVELSAPQLPTFEAESAPSTSVSPPNAVAVLAGEVSPVILIGSYDLPDDELEALRQDKGVVLTLMKQDVRSYFARAAIMHRMAARFDGREEGIACLAREFGFSEKHCDNCLNLHDAFGDQIERFEANLIPATVGYEIARCDAAFKETILARFETGEPPTVADVKSLRRAWRRKERPAKPAPAPVPELPVRPTLESALAVQMPIAAAKTAENLLVNLKGAATEIDRALIPKRGGGYRLAPVEQLAGNLQSYCDCARRQLTVLVRPLHPNERTVSERIHIEEGSIADKGLVALLVVTERLSTVRKLKIGEETPWIVGVAAPILRWAAGRKVDGIETVFDDAFKAMGPYDREILKKPNPAA